MILTSVGYQENQMSVLETAEAHQDLYFFVVLFLKTQVDSILRMVMYVSVLLSHVISPSPSCSVTLSLFFMSVSPLLPCKQDHQYHLSGFHLCALIYDICLLFLTQLQLVQQALGSSTSLELIQMCSFLWLSNIPLLTYTTISLSIHLPMEIQVASMSQLLYLVLQ